MARYPHNGTHSHTVSLTESHLWNTLQKRVRRPRIDVLTWTHSWVWVRRFVPVSGGSSWADKWQGSAGELALDMDGGQGTHGHGTKQGTDGPGPFNSPGKHSYFHNQVRMPKNPYTNILNQLVTLANPSYASSPLRISNSCIGGFSLMVAVLRALRWWMEELFRCPKVRAGRCSPDFLRRF